MLCEQDIVVQDLLCEEKLCSVCQSVLTAVSQYNQYVMLSKQGQW